MKKLSILCAIALILSSCEDERLKGNIEGRFLNGSEMAVSAHISLLDTKGVLKAESITNEQGYFLLNDLDVGVYSVLGNMEGKAVQLDNVSVSENATTTILLNLKKKLAVKAYLLDGNSFSSSVHCSVHNFDVFVANTPPQNILESQVADEYTNDVGVAEFWDLEPGKYVFLFWDNTTMYDIMVQYYNGDETLVISYVFNS